MEQTYTTRSVGQPNTADHRMYMETSGQAISAFHDVALYVDPSKTILNMVVTVPRWTNAKFQVRSLLSSKVWHYRHYFTYVDATMTRSAKKNS